MATSNETEESPEAETEVLLQRQTTINKGKVLRARIVSAIIPLFFMAAGNVRDRVLAQYLLTRLAEEDGYRVNTTEFSPCYTNKSDPLLKEANVAQEKESEMNIYLSLLQSGPALLACLVIGSYADYLGRRFLVLFPVFTGTVKMVLTSLFIRYDVGYWLLYLAYGLDGISGSWFSLLLGLFALTADINDAQQDRSFWIYFISFASSAMEALTNIVDGYIINSLGFLTAMIVLNSMCAFSFLVGLFILPETLKTTPGSFIWNPLTHLRRISGFYFFDGSIRRRLTFCVCITLFFFGVVNDLNLGPIDTLYQLHEPFCWTSSMIGNYAALRVGSGYILGLFLLMMIQKCLNVNDEYIAMIGICFQAGAYLYEAFILKTWQFYLVPVIYIPGTFPVPIIRGMLSYLAGPSQQGAVFSSIAVLETVCNMASYTAYNKVYMNTVSSFSGAVYILMASCSFFTFIMFIVYFVIRDKNTTKQHVLLVNADSDEEPESR